MCSRTIPFGYAASSAYKLFSLLLFVVLKELYLWVILPSQVNTVQCTALLHAQHSACGSKCTVQVSVEQNNVIVSSTWIHLSLFSIMQYSSAEVYSLFLEGANQPKYLIYIVLHFSWHLKMIFTASIAVY